MDWATEREIIVMALNLLAKALAAQVVVSEQDRALLEQVKRQEPAPGCAQFYF